MLKDFVKAILQYHEHNTYQNHRFVQTLQRDIKEDVIAAFELSEPLVQRHFKHFRDSASFVGFLFDLCDIQLAVPLHRPNDDHSSPTAAQLKQCKDELQAQRETYDRALRAREAFWQAKVEQLEAARPPPDHDDCQKKIQRLQTINSNLVHQVKSERPSSCVHDQEMVVQDQHIHELEDALKACRRELQALRPPSDLKDFKFKDMYLDDLDMKPEDQDLKSEDQSLQTEEWCPQTVDHGLKTEVQGMQMMDQGFQTEDQGLQTEDQGLQTEGLQTMDQGFQTVDQGRYVDEEIAEIEATVRRALSESLHVPVQNVRNAAELRRQVERAIDAARREAAQQEIERCAERLHNLQQKLEASQDRFQKLRQAPEDKDLWRKDLELDLENERQQRETAEQTLRGVNHIVVDALDEYFKFNRSFDDDVMQNAEKLKEEIQIRSRELEALRAETEHGHTEMHALQSRHEGLLRTLQNMKVVCSHVDAPGREEQAEPLLHTLEQTRRTIQDILAFVYERRGNVTDVTGNIQSNLKEIQDYVRQAEKERQAKQSWIKECSGLESDALEDLKATVSARSDQLVGELRTCRWQLQAVQGHFANVYTGVTGGSKTDVTAAEVKEILDQFEVQELMRKQAEADLKTCAAERQRLDTAAQEVDALLVDTIEALNFRDVKFEPKTVNNAKTLSGLVQELNEMVVACRAAAGIEKSQYLRTDLERLRDVLERPRDVLEPPRDVLEPPAVDVKVEESSSSSTFKGMHPYKSKSPYKIKSHVKSTYFVTESVHMYQRCIQRLKDLFSCLYEYHFKTAYHSGGWREDPQMRELSAQTSELDAVVELLRTLRDTQTSDLDAVNAVVTQFFIRLIGEIRSSGELEEGQQCTNIHGYLQEVAAQTEAVIRQLHHEIHTTLERSNVSSQEQEEEEVILEFGAKKRKTLRSKLNELVAEDIGDMD